MTGTDAGDPAPRPRPQYGEYAPPGWVSPNEPVAPPPAAPPAAPVVAARAWDRPLTLALLVVGFFGMSLGVYAGLNLELVLDQAALVQGTVADPPSWVRPAGLAVAVSHVALYAVALTGGLTLLRRGRPAYWAPLAAGILAALIYNGVTGSAALASGVLATLP